MEDRIRDRNLANVVEKATAIKRDEFGPGQSQRDAEGDTHHDTQYADLRSQIAHAMDDDYRRSQNEVPR